jgi:hypothetical protein
MSLTVRTIAVAVAMTALLRVSSSAAQKRDPYLLTQEEIASRQNIRTAFEAVQQLRPRFLRGSKTWTVETQGGAGHPESANDPSGGSSLSDGILVVVDGVRRGGVEELKGIAAADVESIRFIKSEEARDHYGPQSGVIEVRISLRGKSPG